MPVRILRMPESGIAKNLLLVPERQMAARVEREPEISEDSILIESVCAGEREAFDALYRKYSPLVHGILLSRGPREEVDDLVQDVFLTVFRKLHTLNDRDAFGPWVASIARRRAADFYRSWKPTVEIGNDERGSEIPVEEAREVLSAIRDLPEAYNETLVLRLVEGMTGPEIAERTGLTPDSVRVNLHRGMKLLRKRLGIGDQR